MIHPEKVVSIHPYFKVHPGKLAEAKGLLRQLVERTATESANLYYDFTLSGDEVFCREAYVGAQGLLTHVDNVTPLLEQFLKIVDIVRIEVHGAQAELDRLTGPLAPLNPKYYVFDCGVVK